MRCQVKNGCWMMVARMGILLGGGDFAAEAGAPFFCKRKNAQKAPLAGSGVFCAFILYGDGLKKDGVSLCVRACMRCEFTAVAHGVSILS